MSLGWKRLKKKRLLDFRRILNKLKSRFSQPQPVPNCVKKSIKNPTADSVYTHLS